MRSGSWRSARAARSRSRTSPRRSASASRPRRPRKRCRPAPTPARDGAWARATRLAEEAKGGDFVAAAKKAGAVTGETSRFSRTKPAEKLPGDAMLAALRAPLGAVTEPVKTQQGYYVLRVLERLAPDPGALAKESDAITREVLTEKQNQAWR